jgi:hypothetical protein
MCNRYYCIDFAPQKQSTATAINGHYTSQVCGSISSLAVLVLFLDYADVAIRDWLLS